MRILPVIMLSYIVLLKAQQRHRFLHVARDRVLHALVISAIRLHYPEFASNDGAAAIDKLTDEQLNEVKALIMKSIEHYQAFC